MMSDEKQMMRLEGLEEYRAILEDTAAMNGRRQKHEWAFCQHQRGVSDRAWIPPGVIPSRFLVDRRGVGRSYFRDPSPQYVMDSDHRRIQETYQCSPRAPSIYRRTLQF